MRPVISSRRDLWWAEGAGLLTGAVLGAGVSELQRGSLWRGAEVVTLAVLLRLASFALWQRMLPMEEAGGGGASVPPSPPPQAIRMLAPPSPEPPETVPPAARETGAQPPSPPRGRPIEEAREEDPLPGAAAGEPELPEGGNLPPAGSPEDEPGLAAGLSPAPERMVDVWDACRREGEGHFDGSALRRALTAAGLEGEVLDEERGGPGRNLFAVDPCQGAGPLFLLPLPGATVRSVADWFFSPTAGGSRLARIQRLVEPAVVRRQGAGWELVKKGVVE